MNVNSFLTKEDLMKVLVVFALIVVAQVARAESEFVGNKGSNGTVVYSGVPSQMGHGSQEGQPGQGTVIWTGSPKDLDLGCHSFTSICQRPGEVRN